MEKLSRIQKALTHEYVLLFGIVLLAGILRFCAIKSFPAGLYWDEAFNGINARHVAETGEWSVFYSENFGREGLFINLQGYAVRYFGINKWALRIVSGIFGTSTVLAIYLLAKEIYGKNVGLWSSFFMATGLWHLIFSRIGFRAIMSPFFLTLSMYFLLKAFNSITVKTEGKSKGPSSGKIYIIFAVAAGIFYGLGFHSYISYRLSPLIVLYVFYYYWYHLKAQRRLYWTALLTFCVVTTLMTVPLLNHFYRNPKDFLSRTMDASIFCKTFIYHLVKNTITTFGMYFVYGDSNWRHNLAHQPQLCFPVAVAFLFGIYLAIRQLYSQYQPVSPSQKGSLSDKLLLVWLIVMALPGILSWDSPHALRCLLTMTPAYILAGLGAERIRTYLVDQFWNKHSVVLSAGMVMLVVGTTVNVCVAYFSTWGGHAETLSAFAYPVLKVVDEMLALPLDVPKYLLMKVIYEKHGGFKPCLALPIYLMGLGSFDQLAEVGVHVITPVDNVTIPPGAFFANMTEYC